MEKRKQSSTPGQEWSKEFEQEKKRIEDKVDKKIFDPKYKGIYHIGSTSIKGISYATPFFDMGLFINQEITPSFIKQMEELGYTYVGGAPHDPNGYYNWFMNFQSEEKGFDLHVVEPEGHDNLFKIKCFSEYLSRYPEERKLYEEYKENSIQNNLSFVDYKRGKQDLCIELCNRAKKWYLSQKEFTFTND